MPIAPGRIPVVLRSVRPRVLILNGEGLADLAEVRELRLGFPGTRLVLVGQGLSSAESAQLLAFGASACLAKDTQARDLRNAIHLASRGLQLMPGGGGAAVGVGESLLTPREADVLVLLRQNRSNAQIALALHIGMETVRSHARSIYRKFGVPSRRALLAAPGVPEAAPAAPARPTRRRASSPVAARRPRHL